MLLIVVHRHNVVIMVRNNVSLQKNPTFNKSNQLGGRGGGGNYGGRGRYGNDAGGYVVRFINNTKN
jgi:hypothetical protein